jgi:DNA-binding MarR family transcriptional regulator
MDFDHTASAGYLIHHVSRLFFEGLRQRIEPLGIVPGQFPALLALWQQDGQTQKQLIEKLDIEQATMANTLQRMERDGLVVRKDHPTDGRAKIVCLTAKAMAIRDEAYAAANSVNDMVMNDLSPGEREMFIYLMRRIIRTFPKE